MSARRGRFADELRNCHLSEKSEATGRDGRVWVTVAGWVGPRGRGGTDGREDARRSGLRSRGDRRLLHRPHERSLGVESIAELVAAATKKVDGCGQH